MKNQLSTVTEVVVRSIFYIITNYVFVSMGRATQKRQRTTHKGWAVIS